MSDSLAGLPFRPRQSGGRTFLEYDGGATGGDSYPCWLYDYQSEFRPVCKLLEMYRELEKLLAAKDREIEEVRGEVGKLKETIAHKDKVMVGYESQLAQQKKTRTHQ